MFWALLGGGIILVAAATGAWFLRAVEEAENPGIVCPCCATALPQGRMDPRVAISMLRLSPAQRTLVDPMAALFGQWINLAVLEAQFATPLGINGLNATLWGLRKRLLTVGLTVESAWGQRRLTWRRDT